MVSENNEEKKSNFTDWNEKICETLFKLEGIYKRIDNLNEEIETLKDENLSLLRRINFLENLIS